MMDGYQTVHRYVTLAAFLALAACGGEPEARSVESRDSLILIGAGDIASCNSTGDERTAALLDRFPNGTVFTVGDSVYPEGTAADFAECFEPSWGRHRHRIRPAVGNHEYRTENAEPFFAYFGQRAGEAGRGYYSYELGSWRILVLNTELPVHRGSRQEQWLRDRLATDPRRCTLAYFHRPRFSSGESGGDEALVPVWEALYEAGAEVVISGHDHHYERFARQAPDGRLDLERGIRQFIVGVGGRGFYGLDGVAPNSIVRNNQRFGVLKLVLEDDGYRWEFVPVEDEDGFKEIVEGMVLEDFSDSGGDECH